MAAGRLRRALGVRVISVAALRWAAAAALVTGAHGGAAWLALNWAPAPVLAGEPPPAVMVELAPVAAAPEAPAQDVAPGPEMVEAQPDTAPEEVKQPVEPPPPEPEPVVEPAPEKPVVETPPEPPPPEPQPELKIPPPQEKAEAVLSPPPPPPKPAKKPAQKKRKAERQKPVNPDKPPRQSTTAPPAAQAHQSDQMAAPAAGASHAPSVSPATWKSALSAHLNRHKRFPADASASGTAHIAFTIARSGRVLSARLTRSSGDAALDREAVALPRRASPMPAPPDGFGGATVTLSVPIRFDR